MVCDKCGIDAVDEKTGTCSYCPQHEKDLRAVEQAEGSDVAPDVPAPKKKGAKKK